MSRKTIKSRKHCPIVRNISRSTHAILFGVSAGRCEICNKLITIDENTNKSNDLGEKAHIRAFNFGGARASSKKLHDNSLNNLILVCPNCHTLIDKRPEDYTVGYLKQIKADHERRIKVVTSFGPKQEAKVLVISANIDNRKVMIDEKHLIQPLIASKLSPHDQKFYTIDLTNQAKNSSTYWNSGIESIDEGMHEFNLDLQKWKNEIKNVAVFGLAPIPLLLYLGTCLDNTINTKLFPKFHDNMSWAWKSHKANAAFKFATLKKGKNKKDIALCLSISGKIDRRLLPQSILQNYYIYELSAVSPRYDLLKSEGDLINFKKEYISVISKIKSKHMSANAINLFPAIPNSAAIACGMGLNKNSDPEIRVYNSFNRDVFTYALTINKNKK